MAGPEDRCRSLCFLADPSTRRNVSGRGSRVQRPCRDRRPGNVLFFVLFVSFSHSAHRRTILSEPGIGKENPWLTWLAGGGRSSPVASRDMREGSGTARGFQGLAADMQPPITSRGFALERGEGTIATECGELGDDLHRRISGPVLAETPNHAR